MKRQPFQTGFTLIEMVVTVALVAIIASVVTPIAHMQIQRQKERDLKAALREIRAAIDAYKQAGDEGRIARSAESTGYPESLDELVKGVTDMRDPKGRKIFFLRRIPRDPMSPTSQGPAGDDWGKRSYASEPDDPQEGDDIYDVHSRSNGNGLNGIPYHKW
ncbi:type II secretion system protein [Paraburkholderia rhizosphaerae]|uniref:General secretion pathway protein G n=1 Tax=Paraburkholderia rhizosphaerae TaxID=480658 RepID=A0A4R8L5R9_9BURK|nr:type II secretion system protein [Paraburkholderia rhizosphaerae]TDY37170.1 general secretion pathway protein G [Paraburkholderia rhizosphaerae]